MPDWPEGLIPYKRTPEFTEATIPAGLLRAHATKPGSWACLHVLEGRLRFRDLARDSVLDLDSGVHPLIRPDELHEVEAVGPVRFFVEFCHAADADSGR